jgi:hypothetical protein
MGQCLTKPAQYKSRLHRQSHQSLATSLPATSSNFNLTHTLITLCCGGQPLYDSAPQSFSTFEDFEMIETINTLTSNDVPLRPKRPTTLNIPRTDEPEVIRRQPKRHIPLPLTLRKNVVFVDGPACIGKTEVAHVTFDYTKYVDTYPSFTNKSMIGFISSLYENVLQADIFDYIYQLNSNLADLQHSNIIESLYNELPLQRRTMHYRDGIIGSSNHLECNIHVNSVESITTVVSTTTQQQQQPPPTEPNTTPEIVNNIPLPGVVSTTEHQPEEQEPLAPQTQNPVIHDGPLRVVPSTSIVSNPVTPTIITNHECTNPECLNNWQQPLIIDRCHFSSMLYNLLFMLHGHNTKHAEYKVNFDKRVGEDMIMRQYLIDCFTKSWNLLTSIAPHLKITLLWCLPLHPEAVMESLYNRGTFEAKHFDIVSYTQNQIYTFEQVLSWTNIGKIVYFPNRYINNEFIKNNID